MSAHAALVEQFEQRRSRLAERAPEAQGTDAERAARAKAVFRKRLDANMR